MKRRTEAQWRALFAEQASSGMTAAAFCRERGLCPKYFGLRRKQLLGAEGAEAAKVATSSFVPVTVAGSFAPSMIEVHCGDALRLHLPVSVSPRWLAELVQQLRS